MPALPPLTVQDRFALSDVVQQPVQSVVVCRIQLERHGKWDLCQSSVHVFPGKRSLNAAGRPKDIPPGRDAGGIGTHGMPRILRLVQRAAMLLWLRWQQPFDLPVHVPIPRFSTCARRLGWWKHLLKLHWIARRCLHSWDNILSACNVDLHSSMCMKGCSMAWHW